MIFMYLGSLILRGATLASMVTVRFSLSTTTPDFSAARPVTDSARISSNDVRFIGKSFQPPASGAAYYLSPRQTTTVGLPANSPARLQVATYSRPACSTGPA